MMTIPSHHPTKTELNIAMNTAVFQSLFPLSLALGIIFLTFALLHLFIPSSATNQNAGISLAISSLLCFLLALILKYKPPSPIWTYPISFIILFIGLFNSLQPIYLWQEPALT